ncbi:MAG: HU family DNA-binding protein [Bacteroides sp.]|nr:HU family DNA-binding protein [Bacteroides sp.]
MSTISTENLKERLAKSLDIDSEQIDKLWASLVETIKNDAEQFDTVAIPGFGTFAAIKHEETLDTSGGSNRLLPPNIALDFKTSVVIRKKITG